MPALPAPAPTRVISGRERRTGRSTTSPRKPSRRPHRAPALALLGLLLAPTFMGPAAAPGAGGITLGIDPPSSPLIPSAPSLVVSLVSPCVGNVGVGMSAGATPYDRLVLGTLAHDEALGSTSGVSCPAPPSTAELWAIAPHCPPVVSGVVGAIALPGVYCGPMVPTGFQVVCALRPDPDHILGNAIANTGITAGLDRNGDGVLRGWAEIAQDATALGPAPVGVVLFNPGPPVRVIAYPTNLDGPAIAPTDANLVGCQASGAVPTVPFTGPTFTPPPPPPPGPIPPPPLYHGGISPASTRRHSPDSYTPTEGAAPKELCFCGQGGRGAGGMGTVDVVSGEFTLRLAPLRVAAARGSDWEFNITYRTLSPDATHVDANGVADLGLHWDYSYGRHFVKLPSGDLRFFDGDGLNRTYLKSGGSYTTPLGYYDVVTHSPVSGATRRWERDGTVEVYQDGLLQSITDRHGNSIRFRYDGNLLVESTDTHDRVLKFDRDAAGRLAKIRDFAGRSVEFAYCGAQLCHIEGLGGTNATFTYYGPAGGMREVFDAKNASYMENHYDGDYRVSHQRYGNAHQLFRFAYRAWESVTTVYDRNGNRVDHHYRSWDVPVVVKKVVFSNRDVDPSDAPFYVTRHAYNKHLEITRTGLPNGNAVLYEFDENQTDPRAQGNVLKRIEDPGAMCAASEAASSALALPPAVASAVPAAVPGPVLLPPPAAGLGLPPPGALPAAPAGGASCQPRVTMATYLPGTLALPVFDRVLTAADARGIDPTFVPPNGGVATFARYTTAYTYDPNGDLVQAARPATHPFGPPEGFSAFADDQTAIDAYTYNAHGQVTSHTDANGAQEAFAYYASNGIPGDPSDTEGYLANHTVDPGGLALKTNYTYDWIGNVLNITDPAGNAGRLDYDERCLVGNVTGPPLFGYDDELSPKPRHLGEDNVSTDERRSPVAGKARLAWAMSATEAERLALEATWASLPENIGWFLLNASQRTAYLGRHDIFVNETKHYLRDGVDGTYLPVDNDFLDDNGKLHEIGTFYPGLRVYITAAGDFWRDGEDGRFAPGNYSFRHGDPLDPDDGTWDTGGTWLGLSDEERHFLQGERQALDWAVSLIGPPDVEPVVLEARKPTLAAKWVTGHLGVSKTYLRDANGQPTQVVRQTDTQVAAAGSQRERPGAKVDETTYNLLGQVTREVLHTSPELPDAPPRSASITEFYYDYNENLVCKRYPMAVQAGLTHNAEFWVYNERDLLYTHAWSDVNASLDLAKLLVNDGQGVCQDSCPFRQVYTDIPCPSLGTDRGERWNYDGNGNVWRHIDARGNATLMRYNGFDERTATLDALGYREELAYDPVGNLVEEKRLEPAGDASSPPGVVVAGVLALPRVALAAEADDRLLSWTRHAHDERSRRYETARALLGEEPLLPALGGEVAWVAERTEHDPLDRVVRAMNANGHAATTTYDRAGRAVNASDAAGNFVAKVYDAASNVVREHHHDEGPGGMVHDRFIVREFDADGRLLNETDSDGRTTRRAYDARDDPVAADDATGKVEKTVTDGAGRLIAEYTRMGAANLTDTITAPFALPGYALAAGGTFAVTFRVCGPTPGDCEPADSCVPATNATCMGLFTEPCAFVDAIEDAWGIEVEIPHGSGCVSFLPGNRSRTLTLPDGADVTASQAMVHGTFTYPHPAEFQCWAVRWPNFACQYQGPMAPILKPSGTLVPGCVNPSMCPTPPGSFANGTVLRAYPGPYWDQHRNNDTGAWNGYTYYHGITRRQAWDLNSRLVARTDGEGYVTRYAYDDRNRQVEEIYADGATTTKAYDDNHNVVRLQDPNGNDVRNAYDEVNRLVNVTVSRGPTVVGTDHQNFTYDGLGRKVASLDEDTADPDGAVQASWVYDSLGRVTEETVQGHTVASTYDPAGHRVRVQYPGGRLLALAYNELELLARVADLVPGNVPGLPAYLEDTLAEYDHLGTRLAQRTYGNGANRTIAYEAGGANSTQPSRIEDRDADGNLLLGLAFTYDDAGHKATITRTHAPSHSEAFALDPADRLVQYKRGTLSGGAVVTPAPIGLSSQTWELTHGNDWNATTVEEVAPVTHVRLHDARHELLLDMAGGPPRAFAYDPNGNLVNDSERLYRWDFQNRLVAIEDAVTGEVLHRYRYDADGRRVRDDRADGSATVFVLDGPQEIEERTASGAVVRQFVFGPGLDEVILVDMIEVATGLDDVAPAVAGALASATGTVAALHGLPVLGEDLASRFYFLLDDQRSTVALADDEGKLVEGYEYSPYGLPTVYAPGSDGVLEWGGGDDARIVGGASPLGNRVLYTGRSWDGLTGLHYFRSRYMSSETGRFVSQDTIGIWGDAQSLGNGFAYAANAPVLATDPAGTAPEGCTRIPSEPGTSLWDCGPTQSLVQAKPAKVSCKVYEVGCNGAKLWGKWTSGKIGVELELSGYLGIGGGLSVTLSGAGCSFGGELGVGVGGGAGANAVLGHDEDASIAVMAEAEGKVSKLVTAGAGWDIVRHDFGEEGADSTVRGNLGVGPVGFEGSYEFTEAEGSGKIGVSKDFNVKGIDFKGQAAMGMEGNTKRFSCGWGD